MFFPCLCNSFCGLSTTIVWARTGTGYRIENLQRKYFNLVVTLIKQYYFQNDVLLNAVGMGNDKRSVTYFIIHILHIMSEGSSLLLIDDRDETVVGVLLLSVVDKMNFGRSHSQSNLQYGRTYAECVSLRNTMQKKIDFFIDYKANVLMRFYLVCIADEHRGRGLTFHLFRAAIEIARNLRITLAYGVFTSNELQGSAKKVGFQVVDVVKYTDWFEINEDETFEAPDPHHTVALMVANIALPSPRSIPSEDQDEKKDKTKKLKGK